MRKLLLGLLILTSIKSFAEPAAQSEKLNIKTYNLILGQGVGFNIIDDHFRNGLIWVICSPFEVKFRGYGEYSLGPFYGGNKSSLTFTNRNPLLISDDGKTVADKVLVECNYAPNDL